MLLNEIQKQYRDYRMLGKTRDETIRLLMQDYENELSDIDDAAWIAAGMTLALCKKHELTPEIATNLRKWFRKSTTMKPKLYEIAQLLSDPEMYGREAVYQRRRKYAPKWEIGDLFSHTMTHPASEKIGFLNWEILFYKFDEYVDQSQAYRQLMYVTICSPEKVPQTADQLQQLCFLRMMCHGDTWDYWGQIVVKSQRELLGYELTKLGNFPGIVPPEDQAPEDPLVAMPLFGRMKKDALRPGYEDQICRLIKSYRQEERFI